MLGFEFAADTRMDAQSQLDMDRKRLEVELLSLERQRLDVRPWDAGVIADLDLQIERVLSSLGSVNAQLAVLRHGSEKDSPPSSGT